MQERDAKPSLRFATIVERVRSRRPTPSDEAAPCHRPSTPGTWALAATSVVLASCAMFQAPKVAPGTSLAETVQRLGSPSAEYRLGADVADDGALRVDTSGRAVRRLEYTAGSFGSHTWMLDFDAGDRMLASAQVRSEPRFGAVRPGMGKDQVLRTLGLPSNTMRLARNDLQLWNYRYESPVCQWFQITVDKAGRVVDAGYGPDPLCTSDEP